jgi:hypothetical protein
VTLKSLRAALFIGVAVTGLSGVLSAQNTNNNDIEIEKLKIEAQERARQEAERRDWETKIFTLKYVDPNQLTTLLSVFRASIKNNPNLHALAVNAPKEIMPAIEDVIKRFDVPPSASAKKDAELTIHVIMASDQPASGTLPPALQPIINQLKNVLSYKGYQLVDTIMNRGNGAANLQGTLPVPSQFPGATTYMFSAFFEIDNRDEKAPLLRLRQMRFILNIPFNQQGNTQQVTIGTDVEIPRGQQVVVGKATFGDKAFILVMSAKFD